MSAATDSLRARLLEKHSEAAKQVLAEAGVLESDDVPDGWFVVGPKTMARLRAAVAERDNLQQTVDYDLIYQRMLEAKITRVEALLAEWDADGETDYSIRRDLRSALNGDSA